MIDINAIEIQASGDGDITEEELDNLKMLYTTPEGTIPMERDKGIDISFLSAPSELSQHLYSVEIIKKTRLYSNVEVSNITFSEDHSGKIRAKVVVCRGK